MKAPVVFIVSAVASLVAAAPALAHKAQRTAPTPTIVVPDKTKATTDKPANTETAPRICLFSVDGKAQAPKRREPASDAKKQDAVPTTAPAKPAERVCNIATPPAPTPLG